MKDMRFSKLKSLFEKWPNHTVLTSDWLLNHGYTHSNIQKYVSSRWIKNVSSRSGAYVRPHDIVELEGAIYGLQQQYPEIFYIGGKTALEKQGAAHYVSLAQLTCFIISTQNTPLPFWFLDFVGHKGVCLIQRHQNILPPALGLTFLQCGEFQIQIASRERAAIEMANEVQKHHSFDECCLVFENLSTLRPELVQKLLENCSSIKAKRVFLFLCDRLKLPWFKHINFSTIHLGNGSRQFVKEGSYSSQYQMTYPKELFENDTLSI